MGLLALTAGLGQRLVAGDVQRRRRCSGFALRRPNGRRRGSTCSCDSSASNGAVSSSRGEPKRRRGAQPRRRPHGVGRGSVVVCGKRSWWELSAPGSAVNMPTASDARYSSCGRDGTMAGGEERSAWWDGSWRTGTKGASKGKESGAHRDVTGQVSGLGDALVEANRHRRSPARGGGDKLDGDASGRRGLLPSSRGRRRRWRCCWTS